MVLPELLSQSWYTLFSFGDLMNLLSAPRRPVPLFFCSCTKSKLGLFMFFHHIVLLEVVIACSVPEIAICGLSKYPLSKSFKSFLDKKNDKLLTPFVPFVCFIGSKSGTPPAPLKEGDTRNRSVLNNRCVIAAKR